MSRALVLLAATAPPPCVAQLAVTPEAEAKSADGVARELANPNTSLSSLAFKNQFRWYAGELPGAGDQENFTLVFQPVFPFTLAPDVGPGMYGSS